jgi:hypothetical protein
MFSVTDVIDEPTCRSRPGDSRDSDALSSRARAANVATDINLTPSRSRAFATSDSIVISSVLKNG